MLNKEEEQLVEGTTMEALPSATFKVQAEHGIVLCYLSGKMRLHHIKVMPGDRVLLRLSSDKNRGIIMRRL
jgi:translation initiation factor IF-1